MLDRVVSLLVSWFLVDYRWIYPDRVRSVPVGPSRVPGGEVRAGFKGSGSSGAKTPGMGL